MQRLSQCHLNPTLIPIELELCRRDILHWFDWWCWTYDPRLATHKLPTHIPLDLWQRQREMILFIDRSVQNHEDGLIEKSRDIGFTWNAGGYALHHWLFVDGFKTSFGSRKEEYVDRRGEPDSIFEKIRMLLHGLPRWMWPVKYNPDRHDNHMRLINPQNGNTIRGEAGDEMGRGGRSSLYFIDEAAHLEHGETVEAATSANTDSRIWASSVNGMGNIFARKRWGGSLRQDQIFRFHYTDDPRKTPEWAAKKKASMEEHSWAAEYDIDYSASVEGICIPARWVEAAVELGKRIKVEPSINGAAGMDVGAGKAKSVFCARFGPVVFAPIAWGNPDTIETAHRGLEEAAKINLKRSDGFDCVVRTLLYDSIGVGRGVQDALKYADHHNLKSVPVNVGAPPSTTQWPDGETSEEKFVNLKAELWWTARARFKAAYEHLLFLDEKTGGQEHSTSDIIVLPSPTEGKDAQLLIGQISLVRWFRNEKGKIIMESKQQLAQRDIASPDHAEAFMLTFANSVNGIELWEKLAG